MNTWRLVEREIAHRKLNFTLGVLSVAVAAGCLVAQFTLLRAHDLRTGELLDAKEEQVDKRLKKLEDEYRKLTLKLGFNVRILPDGQDLGEFYAEGFAQKTMDEEFVHKLAESKLLTSIRHLLPKLERKIEWPERSRKIILLGTHGEVPIRERTDPKKPIVKLIPDGQVDVGHELWQSLGLKPGDKIKLLGEEFTIRKCHEEQGSRADITIWLDLRKAQELLKMPGVINEIQAVDCKCAWANIDKIRSELAKILPNTQAIITLKAAAVRKRARVKAEEERKEALEQERAGRAELREEREAFAAILVPLITAVCVLWIGLLTLGNVRERSSEIGILRAIGLRSGQVFTIFIGRALLIGIIGAILGYGCGFLVGAMTGQTTDVASMKVLFIPWLLLSVVVAAPVLTALASWLPARIAARQDPALVLREK